MIQLSLSFFFALLHNNIVKEIANNFICISFLFYLLAYKNIHKNMYRCSINMDGMILLFVFVIKDFYLM